MTLEPVSTGDPHVAAHNEERDAINANTDELDNKIDKPTVPTIGSLLRYNGTNWVESVSRLFEGNGQPEGNVAAPIGSRYVDLNSSQGAVEWLKANGIDTSNTGWILLAGDTGWRNVESLVNKRTTAHVTAALLRRVNMTVDLYLDMEMPENDASPYPVLDLPIGFCPDFTRYGGLQQNNENAAGSTSVGAGGTVDLYNIVSGRTDRWNGQWLTSRAWPSSLPGTAG